MDFDSEWQELIVKNYNPSEAAVANEPEESVEWKIKVGSAGFVFNNENAYAILSTMSGYNRCASIVITSNSPDYMKDIESLLGSVELITPEPDQLMPIDGANPTVITNPGKFAFTTTNFDNGWVSVVKEDWVEVTKQGIKVLIHYPNKVVDDYSPDLLEGLKEAWDVLVAPRYSSAKNFEFKPIRNWESIEFAEADVIENSTGRQVHVVLFKKNLSGGHGKYLEFITTDKKTFEMEFGPYNAEELGWDKMVMMAGYNKFAVAESDLQHKWTNKFTGIQQYVNAVTGLDAGMNTHASTENFNFLPGNQYNWDLVVASGMVGSIKFESVKSSGKFSMIGNWQINFSDLEGKPKTYDVYFSCIKGFRILWIDQQAFARVE